MFNKAKGFTFKKVGGDFPDISQSVFKGEEPEHPMWKALFILTGILFLAMCWRFAVIGDQFRAKINDSNRTPIVKEWTAKNYQQSTPFKIQGN